MSKHIKLETVLSKSNSREYSNGENIGLSTYKLSKGNSAKSSLDNTKKDLNS